MKRKLIGQVGVDSGQLMIIDPCYIDSDWKSDEIPIGIQFWGQGEAEVAAFLKESNHEVLEVNHSFRIMSHDSAYLNNIKGIIENQSLEIGMIVITSFITESTYNAICDLTGSEDSAGQLKYRSGNSGLGVAFTSGLGDGLYDVFATYSDLGKWGERISKVEIILIDEEEIEELI